MLRDGDGAALALAAETATAERLAALRALGPVDLALTEWRAATLKARAYDGDLARVVLPADADLDWVRATADPSADLAWPMKGPYADPARGRRGAAPGGDRALQAGAPAAGGAGGAAGAAEALAAAEGLTVVDIRDVPRRGGSPEMRGDRGGAGAAAGVGGGEGAGFSGRSTGRRSTMRWRSARRTGRSRCSAGCIRPASPAICSAA